jgi:hypothetical protein
MNYLIQRTMTSLVLAVVCFAGTTYAQSSPKVITAHIPFEFNVGGQTFPAGDYSVTQPLQNVLALRDGRGRTIASVLSHEVESSTGPRSTQLRFNHSDGQYTLAEVWQQDGTTTGQQLLQSKSRAKVAQRHTVDTVASSGGSQP